MNGRAEEETNAEQQRRLQASQTPVPHSVARTASGHHPFEELLKSRLILGLPLSNCQSVS